MEEKYRELADKYEEWLEWKASDLEQQIDEYTEANKDKPYSGNQVLVVLVSRYEIYKECLEKYKEGKGK